MEYKCRNGFMNIGDWMGTLGSSYYDAGGQVVDFCWKYGPLYADIQDLRGTVYWSNIYFSNLWKFENKVEFDNWKNNRMPESFDLNGMTFKIGDYFSQGEVVGKKIDIIYLLPDKSYAIGHAIPFNIDNSVRRATDEEILQYTMEQ
jgi:hypothetical protein